MHDWMILVKAEGQKRGDCKSLAGLDCMGFLHRGFAPGAGPAGPELLLRLDKPPGGLAVGKFWGLGREKWK